MAAEIELQIGVGLGVRWATGSQQLHRAGITIRRGGRRLTTLPHQIVDLQDQGLTWSQVAMQVDMTGFGRMEPATGRARQPKSPRLGRWQQQVLAEALDKNLAIGVRVAVADHLGRTPTRAELTAARRAAHSLAALDRAVCFMCRGRYRRQCRRPQLLVQAKPHGTMNDTRLRGLPVAGGGAAGRKSRRNHAQTYGTSDARRGTRTLVPG
jgi:hypothetical protein